MKRKFIIFITVLSVVILSTALIACDSDDNSDREEGGSDTQQAVEEEKTVTFGFISDIHMMDQSEIYDDECESFLSYNYDGQRLIPMAQAILQTVVDKYIEDKVDCVLVCGDLTELGSKTSLEAVARECQRLEDAGISVYISDGFTDINNNSVRFEKDGQVATENASMSDFEQIFYNFGYDEAIARNPNNLSYVCDIAGTDIRLLNLSTAFYDHSDSDEEAMPTLTDEDLDWIEQVLIQAENDNKQVFVMSYYPVSDQLGKNIGNIFNAYSIKLINSDIAAQMFTEHGVKYVVNGHIHLLSEIEYVDTYGASFRALSTGCLSNYPMCYNYITEKDGVWTRETKYLTAIDGKYLPDYIDDEIKEQVTSDLHAYTVDYLYRDLHKKLDYLVSGHYGREGSLFIEYLYRLDFFKDRHNPPEEIVDFALDLTDIFWRFFDIPMYIENETEEHPESVERYMLKYDIVIPESEYVSFADFVVKVFCDLYRDEAELSSGSTNVTLLTYCGYTLFEMIVDFDPFARVKALQPEITYIDWRPIHEKVVREGILDLRQDDALLRLIELVSLGLKERLGRTIKLNDIDTVLSVIKMALPGTLAILFSEDYDPQTETLAGIPYTKYLDLDRGYVNLKLILEEVFFDVWLKELLH